MNEGHFLNIFNFIVSNANNNHHIGSIADYDPIIKQQAYSGNKHTHNSDSQNYNFGVCHFFFS